jgi:Novel STAND NTPase 1
LLSYTLDDMWTQMVKRGDGVLRLPAQSFELGGVLSERADFFLANHPKSEDALRRILTLKLANVREGEEPTRRRAMRSEFTDEEWRLVSELADHPNRLLVTATPESGETYAEVAHEAIFRRWDKLRNWIAAEREFLAWRTGLEAARRAWQGRPRRAKKETLLIGFPLNLAVRWRKRRPDDIPEIDRAFIALSRKTRLRRLWGTAALIYLIMALVSVPGIFEAQFMLKRLDMLIRGQLERNSLAESRLDKLVAAIEADETKTDGKPGKATAAALGEFSWHQLYAGKPEKALAAADRALSLVPDVLWVETRRAHALMFLDRREEALALYLAHKDKPIAANDDKSWQKAIAEDFMAFREAGLHSPLMAEIEEMLGVNREK